MTSFLGLLRALVEGVLRFVPSRTGNDGLTANERRLVVVQHQLTGGCRPPASTERFEHIRTLADKTPGRTWHRSHVEHGAASA